MNKIEFTVPGEKEPACFYVLEQTQIGGFSYLLVTENEDEDEDSEAWILKLRPDEGLDPETSVYEMVEDEEELRAVAAVFEQLLEGVDII